VLFEDVRSDCTLLDVMKKHCVDSGEKLRNRRDSQEWVTMCDDDRGGREFVEECGEIPSMNGRLQDPMGRGWVIMLAHEEEFVEKVIAVLFRRRQDPLRNGTPPTIGKRDRLYKGRK